MVRIGLAGIPEMKGKGEGLNWHQLWEHFGPFPPHTCKNEIANKCLRYCSLWNKRAWDSSFILHSLNIPGIKEAQIPPILWPAQTSQLSAEGQSEIIFGKIWTLGNFGVLAFQKVLVLEEDSQPSVVCVPQGLPNWQGSTRGKCTLINFATCQIRNSVAVLMFNMKRSGKPRGEQRLSTLLTQSLCPKELYI